MIPHLSITYQRQPNHHVIVFCRYIREHHGQAIYLAIRRSRLLAAYVPAGRRRTRSCSGVLDVW